MSLHPAQSASLGVSPKPRYETPRLSVWHVRTRSVSHAEPCSAHCMPQGDRAKLLGVKSDMALFAIIANGNDYLPPIRGCVMDTNGRPKGLWTR